jgi:hypothetical protein
MRSGKDKVFFAQYFNHYCSANLEAAIFSYRQVLQRHREKLLIVVVIVNQQTF